MVDDLKEYAEELVHRFRNLRRKRQNYTYATPFTKESLLYRELFEKYYPGQAADDQGLLDAQQKLGGL